MYQTQSTHSDFPTFGYSPGLLYVPKLLRLYKKCYKLPPGSELQAQGSAPGKISLGRTLQKTAALIEFTYKKCLFSHFQKNMITLVNFCGRERNPGITQIQKKNRPQMTRRNRTRRRIDNVVRSVRMSKVFRPYLWCIVPGGDSVRTKVVQGWVSFIRQDNYNLELCLKVNFLIYCP